MIGLWYSDVAVFTLTFPTFPFSPGYTLITLPTVQEPRTAFVSFITTISSILTFLLSIIHFFLGINVGKHHVSIVSKRNPLFFGQTLLDDVFLLSLNGPRGAVDDAHGSRRSFGYRYEPSLELLGIRPIGRSFIRLAIPLDMYKTRME